MGFTPQQVNAMSMWQYFAALNGFIDANTPEDKKKMSTEEAEELYDWLYEGFEDQQERIARVYFWDENGFVLEDTYTFTTEH